MNIVLGILVGLVVLTFLIVSHELGHFIMARRNGVRVKEFGVGFPPRAIAWVRSKPEKERKKGKWVRLKKSDWQKEQSSLILSINWLPLGGFCAMDGESDDEEKAGTFGSVSYWKKTKILFGGVMMNWLVAFVILTVLAWVGMPAMLENQFTIKSDEKILINEPVSVDEILDGSPAALAGFQTGDQILSASDTRILSASDVVSFNQSHAGETVSYVVSRPVASETACDCVQEPCDCPSETKLETLTLNPTLNPSDSDYLLGITMTNGSSASRYSWSAPVVGAGLTVQMTAETYKGLWNMLINLATGAARQVSPDQKTRAEGRAQVSEATEGVSGIVGIIGGYFPSIISAGPTYTFLLAAIISISLACMNVLPIPALDGGRWFMITLARLRHRKLSKETEQKIVSRAFLFLLALMAVITVLDIIRLF